MFSKSYGREHGCTFAKNAVY